jgi:transketolase
MTTFGASAPIKDLYNKFNITADAAVAKAHKVIAHFQKVGYVPEIGVSL